jgi:hypothetical protein
VFSIFSSTRRERHVPDGVDGLLVAGDFDELREKGIRQIAVSGSAPVNGLEDERHGFSMQHTHAELGRRHAETDIVVDRQHVPVLIEKSERRRLPDRPVDRPVPPQDGAHRIDPVEPRCHAGDLQHLGIHRDVVLSHVQILGDVGIEDGIDKKRPRDQRFQDDVHIGRVMPPVLEVVVGEHDVEGEFIQARRGVRDVADVHDDDDVA